MRVIRISKLPFINLNHITMSLVIRRFITYVGKVKLGDIKQASIQGKELHKSHKDPTDSLDVISIKFFDEDGNRVGTGHVHEDGTAKFRYKQKPPAEVPSSGFE
ncbi:hypothetical protein EMCG_03540 [[Emmonsia] crescens]|uniref:Uncharacterized protein n=1 Tax=[Emmonsia] crescens TaxID=73230 RepID=A0A0G2HVA0_9EURO|nr:hypothetical protein EMCG_03540 [Emmonsia crescens UAMH 3008]